MNMVVTLDSKGRLTLPKSLSEARPGDSFEVTFDPERDAFIIRRLSHKKSWLQVLKECPEKMDDLPPRSREICRSRL